MQSTAAEYLAELRRVTAGLAAGQRLTDVLDAVTRGLQMGGRFASATVYLYLKDAECPVCRHQAPLRPSPDRRLHRVSFVGDPVQEAPEIYHTVAEGQYLAGRAAQLRRTLLVNDLPRRMREMQSPEPDAPTAQQVAAYLEGYGVVGGAFFPLLIGDQLIGLVSVYSRNVIGLEEAAYLDIFALQAAILIRNAQLFDEVEALKERLSRENTYLDLAVREEAGFGGIVGRSEAMRQVLAMVRQVAPADTMVLLRGVTGTGKELFARAIHDASPRAGRPMIKVNCGAIPLGLVESEFFGHERGAFTGAHQRRVGRFELADRGTIFLDEVGELAPETQVGLLRVLQEHEIQRVGGERSIPVDVRVLAATNRDLSADVASGRFRSDLYYRLNVLSIQIPPLRQRREDLPALALHFATQYARRLGKAFAGISAHGLDLLERYDWPGNIRELQNVIERACVLSSGSMIEIADPARSAMPFGTGAAGDASLELDAMEREHLTRVLDRARWRIEGPGGAAELLGMKPSTLRSLMKRLQVARPADVRS